MGWHVGVGATPKGETRHIHIVPCSSPLFWVRRPSPFNTASARTGGNVDGGEKKSKLDLQALLMVISCTLIKCMIASIPQSQSLVSESWMKSTTQLARSSLPSLRSLVSRSPFFAAVHLPISPIAASRRVVGPLSLRVSPCYWKIRLRGLECWLGAGKSLVKTSICNPKPNVSIV